MRFERCVAWDRLSQPMERRSRGCADRHWLAFGVGRIRLDDEAICLVLNKLTAPFLLHER
jgi:hypothetical protein